MGRIAARDTAAVEECLIRYGDLVWSIARRFSATYADAEEAVQEIFVEVWRSAEHYDEKISSEAVYMTMIARRTLIDRKCRCDQELQASLRNDREAPQPQTTVGNVLEKMRNLSEEQQRVLELALAGRFSTTEIARQLDLSIHNVKALARDGLIAISAMRDAADTSTLSLPKEWDRIAAEEDVSSSEHITPPTQFTQAGPPPPKGSR